MRCPHPTAPCEETSCGQVWYYFGQADLWSDVPPVPNPLMPVPPNNPHPHPPPQQRHLVAKCVTTLGRLTFNQTFFHSISDL